MMLDKFLVNIVDQLSALKMRGASKVFRMMWWKISCNTITWYEWASQEINKLLNKKLESFITTKKKNYSQEYWLSLPNLLFTCVTYFFGGFTVIGRPAHKKEHEHTTPNSQKTSNCLGFLKWCFVRGKDTNVLNYFIKILVFLLTYFFLSSYIVRESGLSWYG